MRTGITSLPLHGGHAPAWLFGRMVGLSGAIAEAVADEHGRDGFLRRISDPHWFQAFSCAIGFDWHSSGTTTTTCGALKIALSKNDIGIKVAGGKGAASRKTISEIEASGLADKKISELQYASRMSAKVDNSCVQDGYQLYHHAFIFTEKGYWAVVQQGMNDSFARRYQWLSDNVRGFVDEPHNAISCDARTDGALDMTAKESSDAQRISVDLVKGRPENLMKFFSRQRTLADFNCPHLHMPAHHPVCLSEMNARDIEFLRKAYEFQPKNYEELVSLAGMGPKKIRALALISDLVYGARPSWRDPVKYSFAHGGKDGFPYPVDKEVYDSSIRTLRDAIDAAKVGQKERLGAIKRLEQFIN